LILRKLEAASDGTVVRRVAGTAPISEATRQAGVQRILEALRMSPAADNVDESQLAAAAQVLLQRLFVRPATSQPFKQVVASVIALALNEQHLFAC